MLSVGRGGEMGVIIGGPEGVRFFDIRYKLTYHCVKCDQDFEPEDRFTACPNAAKGSSHYLLEVRTAISSSPCSKDR
jgi:hypothetical protein